MLNKIAILTQNDFVLSNNDNNYMLENRNDSSGIYYGYNIVTNVDLSKFNNMIKIQNRDVELINKTNMFYSLALHDNVMYSNNNIFKTTFLIEPCNKKVSLIQKRDKIFSVDEDLISFIKLSKSIITSLNNSLESFITIIDNVVYFILSNSFILYIVTPRVTLHNAISISFAMTVDRMRIIETYIAQFKDNRISIDFYEHSDGFVLLEILHKDESDKIDSRLQLLMEVKSVEIETIKQKKIEQLNRFISIPIMNSFIIDFKTYSKSMSVINNFINDKLTVGIQIKLKFEDSNVIVSQTDRSSRHIDAIIGYTSDKNRSFIVTNAILNTINAVLLSGVKNNIEVKIRSIAENIYLLSIENVHIAFES